MTMRTIAVKFRCLSSYRAGLTHPVEDGAAAIHSEMVIGLNMRQQLFADGALQVDERTTEQAFKVEMMTAFSPSHVLIDVGRLGIAPIFPHSPLVAKLGQMAVQGALTAPRVLFFPITVQFPRQLIHRELTVGMALQEIQKPLPTRCFIGSGHDVAPPSR